MRFLVPIRPSCALSDPVLVSVPVSILVPVQISATALVSIPAPVPNFILCSLTGLHVRLRSRSRPVLVPVPAPFPVPPLLPSGVPSFASTLVLAPAPVTPPSLVTSPLLFLIPSPRPIPPPISYAPSRSLDLVTPSVRCACTDPVFLCESVCVCLLSFP